MPSPRMMSFCLSALLSGLLLGLPSAHSDDALRERLEDEHAFGSDWWIYNDMAEALAAAREQNKPLFVTFRCVPCEDCSAFDAEVASGNDVIAKLASEKFIPIRQVEMKGVDLSQFQFDYDLNWAAMFINADGTVYARYGTQSAEGADAYNSIEGLKKTMQRVLELHENYPENADQLRGKRGADKPYRTALEMPGLPNKDRFRQLTSRRNCIHCHNLHDAEHFAAQESGEFTHDMLWRFPLPDNLGLKIDPDNGRRIKDVVNGSAAAAVGLQEGEEVLQMNGQAITSIADMQWVLHNLPNDATKVRVTGSESGEKVLALKPGWKETDISWRGSLWSVSPRLRVWTPPIGSKERSELDLAEGSGAFEARWINNGEPGGRAALEGGLRKGDIIVAVDGKSLPLTPAQFQLYVKLNYKVGEKLPVTVIRNGKRRELQIPLVE
ncbi:serine endoprotease [Maioricimonas rarisocia]|uniref:Serine endoprotease n=1 Tax=Maioricimonas rarisocia TaxID=2528026 RepID=A0A517Z7F1_9PLAN|nr:Trx7/PDZ domain-containing (seleno)protein [Maioricimonas rarisocia]QDU38412.1 serine endoprotease [Maioricimonas rarisocia]